MKEFLLKLKRNLRGTPLLDVHCTATTMLETPAFNFSKKVSKF